MTNDTTTFVPTTADGEPFATAARPDRTAAIIQSHLEPADVRLDGVRPWDMRINDRRFHRRVATDGLLGLGESYVDGWWDCDSLDQLFDRCHRAGIPAKLPVTRQAITAAFRNRCFNLQLPGAARRNVEAHYQLGNDLFRAMLDPRMIYTCGYWKNADTLESAQEAKLDLICRKLRLQPGQRVLDIGCGWGGFAKFAAERYDVNVVGITLSRDQVDYARQDCRDLPVDFRLQDYREIDEEFDAVVSIGMVEHVGPKNLRNFMRTARRCLADDGLCLLHFFCGQHAMPSVHDGDMLWINKYIFPGGVVPSITQVAKSLEGLFVLEDLHNFGSDYDPTLMAWFANFDRNWPKIREQYGPRFHRLWKYYLLSCAGTFRARKFQVLHWVLSKNGIPGGYRSAR
jgi:cyclopropane-fatty-acyl-phospholipid synthase